MLQVGDFIQVKVRSEVASRSHSSLGWTGEYSWFSMYVLKRGKRPTISYVQPVEKVSKCQKNEKYVTCRYGLNEARNIRRFDRIQDASVEVGINNGG